MPYEMTNEGMLSCVCCITSRQKYSAQSINSMKVKSNVATMGSVQSKLEEFDEYGQILGSYDGFSRGLG